MWQCCSCTAGLRQGSLPSGCCWFAACALPATHTSLRGSSKRDLSCLKLSAQITLPSPSSVLLFPVPSEWPLQHLQPRQKAAALMEFSPRSLEGKSL